MLRTVGVLARSTHPGPTVAVTAITVILGVGFGLGPARTTLIGLAMVIGQISVGLSNDWLDSERDRAVGRTDKPVAVGLVRVSTVRAAAIVSAVLAVMATIPLGPGATAVHLVIIASAWGYNLGLKATAASVAPYIVSFGLLPSFVRLAGPDTALATVSVTIAGALLGVSAHFANVLPDLADDRATGIQGLPHRWGTRPSGITIAVTLAGASIAIVVGAPDPGLVLIGGCVVSVAIAALCLVSIVTKHPSRMVFRLIIAAALINVVMLAASIRS